MKNDTPAVPPQRASKVPAGLVRKSKRNAALAYAAAGFRVLPGKPGDPSPGALVGKGWDEQSSCDPEVVAAWFDKWPKSDIFIHCGVSGLVVFDLDKADDLNDVPEPYRSALRKAKFHRSRPGTDRGHYVFRTKAGESFGNSPGGFNAFGDVRAAGVIRAQPSTHLKGGRYSWTKSGTIPLLPNDLRRLLKQAAAHEPAMPDAELHAFLDEHSGDNRPAPLRGVVGRFEQQVVDGAGRHNSMVEALPWAFRQAVAGCYPARRAFEELEAAWDRSFDGPQAAARGRTRPTRGEFAGIAAWAAAQALAADPAETLARLDQKVDDAEFWAARPLLSDLRTFAQARRVSPWAMFGAVAARAVAAVPPRVVLPTLIGSQASLNLFVALVGRSGSGKGAAEQAANDFIDTDPPVESATVGSGEGISKLFAYKVRGEQVDLRTAVLFTVPEIDNLTALGNRQGATLIPELRKAWSGERLGFAYADQSKTIKIERHRYRLNLVLGVQPERAGPLMEDSDGGTPQRFMWFPAHDPDAPDLPPAEPPQCAMPAWPLDPPDVDNLSLALPVRPGDLVEIGVPDDAIRYIDCVRLSRLRGSGEGVELEGHAALARLKVAAALMILDGRLDKIDDEDWRLAGIVCEVSQQTRREIERALGERAAKENVKRGRAEGRRAVAAAEAVEDDKIKRAVTTARNALRKDETLTEGVLKNKLRSDLRDYFEPAMERLLATGEVTREESRRFTSYRLQERS